MKRWVIFIFVFLAAAFLHTEMSASEPTVQTFATGSLTPSDSEDYNPIETPHTPLQIMYKGDPSQLSESDSYSWLSWSARQFAFLIHYQYNSVKVCGLTAHRQTDRPRPIDRYIYAYRKIVI